MTLVTQQLKNTSHHRALVMWDVYQLLIELALRSSPNEINLNSSGKKKQPLMVVQASTFAGAQLLLKSRLSVSSNAH